MTMPVSFAEKQCRSNIAKYGKIPKNSCVLCRKINKELCPILEEKRKEEKNG